MLGRRGEGRRRVHEGLQALVFPAAFDDFTKIAAKYKPHQVCACMSGWRVTRKTLALRQVFGGDFLRGTKSPPPSAPRSKKR